MNVFLNYLSLEIPKLEKDITKMEESKLFSAFYHIKQLAINEASNITTNYNSKIKLLDDILDKLLEYQKQGDQQNIYFPKAIEGIKKIKTKLTELNSKIQETLENTEVLIETHFQRQDVTLLLIDEKSVTHTPNRLEEILQLSKNLYTNLTTHCIRLNQHSHELNSLDNAENVLKIINNFNENEPDANHHIKLIQKDKEIKGEETLEDNVFLIDHLQSTINTDVYVPCSSCKANEILKNLPTLSFKIQNHILPFSRLYDEANKDENTSIPKFKDLKDFPDLIEEDFKPFETKPQHPESRKDKVSAFSLYKPPIVSTPQID